LQGREFSPGEFSNTNQAKVAILSQSLARKLWPGENPLGKRVQLTGLGASGGGVGRSLASGAESGAAMEVVGIVPSSRPHLVDPTEGAAIFVPFAQDPRGEVLLHVRPMPTAKFQSLLGSVRAELSRFDPLLPVLAAKSLRSHFRTSPEVWMMRSGAVLFGTLAGSALVLCLIGLYGVMNYYVARRTRDLGIRMALGADLKRVLSLILLEGVKLAAGGMLAGLFLAYVVAKATASLLFGIQALDGPVFLTAPLLSFLTALLACYLPAHRAANLDPIVALRHE
jgi:ABC-type antimicrobial peptide transport system permease subunit